LDWVALSSSASSRIIRSLFGAEIRKNFKTKDELQKQIKKHQLKKFLIVLFFLDRAKENRLINHNPFLFIRNALYRAYRETNEIFKRLASLFLANFGKSWSIWSNLVIFWLINKPTSMSSTMSSPTLLSTYGMVFDWID
jgi:hypothetical protein